MYDSYYLVIPSVNVQSLDECTDSFYQIKDYSDPDNGKFLIHHNRTNNIGVAATWNYGIDRVIVEQKDWLVICSESIRFGENGRKDLERELENASKNTMAIEADNDLGWHLIAFRREVFEKVGYFDELFYPAYYEDNDFSYRYQKAFATTEADYPLWPKVHIDATLIGKAQGLQHVREPINFVELEQKYVQKWGGVSPNETYEHPYNNHLLTYRYGGRRNVP